MDFDRFGNEADRPLLFVLGWGNRPEHEPVGWLIDRLTDDGWYVHTATLPVHVTDVQAEWVDPVEQYATDLAEPAVLGHSAGGLTAAHADIDAHSRTYLSPWWGYPPATDGPLLDAVSKIPLDVRVLPSEIDDTRLLGEYATAKQVADVPARVSPAFVRATRHAHRTLPPARDGAVCFCSLSDRVVSTRAIGDRMGGERVVLYDGGHELFSSRSRDRRIDDVLASIADDPDALE